MNKGIVFDIQEFSVHDGPGIRTTVFLKGCPSRCKWCHNPEGLRGEPEEISGPAGKRIAGKEYTAEELAAILNQQAEILTMNKGGVTFSGGEPLFQALFVSEVIDRLQGLHVLLDTHGYADQKIFCLLAEKSDMIYFDLKLIASEAHLRWTGVDNKPILQNLRILSTRNKPPYVIRIPLVPGVTDTMQNMHDIANTIQNLQRGPERIELLPYNRAAGSKYASCGLIFKPGFIESKDININMSIFKDRGIPVIVK
jgi:pyruvate formate lyase activating enzyme